jgi:hypothetical protein
MKRGACNQKRRPWRTVAGLATACFVLGTLSLHSTAMAASPTREGQEAAGAPADPAGRPGHVSRRPARPVRKRGPLDVRNWHHNYTAQRREAFGAWLAQCGPTDPDVPAADISQELHSSSSSSSGGVPRVFFGASGLLFFPLHLDGGCGLWLLVFF